VLIIADANKFFCSDIGNTNGIIDVNVVNGEGIYVYVTKKNIS